MAGRPKRVFTDELKQQIEQMALDNCHIDTIGLALNIAKNTLIRHYGTFIKQKRAQGRTELRRLQRKLALTNYGMAIFLGKNELGQEDKKTIKQEGGFTLDLSPELVALAKQTAQQYAEGAK